MGAYHLTEWTRWVDYWIMVWVFPKSANQLNKIALNIYDSSYDFGWWDWKLENVRKFSHSAPNGKRRLPLEVVYDLRTDFPENYGSIWFFFCLMVSTLFLFPYSDQSIRVFTFTARSLLLPSFRAVIFASHRWTIWGKVAELRNSPTRLKGILATWWPEVPPKKLF